MLPNTLLILEEALHRRLGETVDVVAVLDYFAQYHKGMWVYPEAFSQRFSLGLSETYAFLSELERQGVIKGCFRLYCSQCKELLGIFETSNELPEVSECKFCQAQFPSVKNIVLAYKVFRDN